MIGITQAGLDELKRILNEHSDDTQAVLRLTTDEKGTLGLILDTDTPEDQVLEHEGSKLLIIEPNLAATLEGITIDVDETPDGLALVMVGKSSK